MKMGNVVYFQRNFTVVVVENFFKNVLCISYIQDLEQCKHVVKRHVYIFIENITFQFYFFFCYITKKYNWHKINSINLFVFILFILLFLLLLFIKVANYFISTLFHFQKYFLFCINLI